MANIYQHEVTIHRLSNLTGGRRGYASVGGEIKCSIQPLNDITASTAGYALEKTYKIYIPRAVEDIKTTDKLIDSDSNEYTVKGIKKYTHANTVTHIEITAELV